MRPRFHNFILFLDAIIGTNAPAARLDIDGATADSTVYTKFTYMLINAVKDLYGQVKAIVARVISLEGKDEAKERAIASVNTKTAKLEADNAQLKARADKAEKENIAMKKENAAVKARLDKIEKMLLKK